MYGVEKETGRGRVGLRSAQVQGRRAGLQGRKLRSDTYCQKIHISPLKGNWQREVQTTISCIGLARRDA